MARRPLVAGNWKMNGLMASAGELEAIIVGARSLPNADFLVCPPTTLVARFAALAQGSRVAIGGQDCHAEPAGAYTGDIAAEMLKDAGAGAVIVGHSERRHYHGETDAMVRAKALAARRADLLAIICVGETRAERDADKTHTVVRAQLDGSLPDGLADFVIAYEPVWAIGTGVTPTTNDVAAHAPLYPRAASRALWRGRGGCPHSLWRLGQADQRQGIAWHRQCRWRADRRRKPQGRRVPGDSGRLPLTSTGRRRPRPAGREDAMKIHRAIAVIAVLGLPLATTAARATEVKLLGGNALNAVMEELGPQFEKATGNKLVITLGTSAQLKARIEGGEAFDAVLLTKKALDELATAGKVADAPRAAIARAGIGVAIRKGAAKPDLSTTDGFKQAMLNAKSIGFVDQTPTAAALKGIFAKLGIADQINSKLKPLHIQAAVAVTNGDVEIAMTQISEILPYPASSSRDRCHRRFKPIRRSPAASALLRKMPKQQPP